MHKKHHEKKQGAEQHVKTSEAQDPTEIPEVVNPFKTPESEFPIKTSGAHEKGSTLETGTKAEKGMKIPVKKGRREKFEKEVKEHTDGEYRDKRRAKHLRRTPQPLENKGRIRHVKDFEGPHPHRPHLLEDLLHFFNHFNKSRDIEEPLSILKEYGMPFQGRLFKLLFSSDPMPFDFEDNIKLMFSYVMRAWSPINTTNRYLPVPRSIPAIQAVRYKGVKMRSDQFVETETLKALHRRKATDQVQSQALTEAHSEFLKSMTLQQMSSLPITVMHDILYSQIEIVGLMCEKYTKLLGSSNVNTKVAVAHYNLMHKHLQVFRFMGLRTMPPLSIVRKYEQPPGEENSGITSSSASEYLEELEHFVEVQHDLRVEDSAKQEQENEAETFLESVSPKAEADSAANAPSAGQPGPPLHRGSVKREAMKEAEVVVSKLSSKPPPTGSKVNHAKRMKHHKRRNSSR